MNRTVLKSLASIMAFFCLLQLLFLIHVQFPYEPSPFQVVHTFISLLVSGAVLPDIGYSTFRVFVGLLIAITIGVPLGLFLAWKQRIGNYITPILEIIRPIPPIAWIPIAILTFGIGNSSAFFIVFIGAFFPVLSNTYFGARSIPAVLVNTCRSYGVSGFTYTYEVLYHYSLPYIFTGLRIAIGVAWMSVIAAELAGVQGGLGYFIQYNRLLLRIDYIIAGMLYIGVLGVIFTLVLRVLERRFVPWGYEKLQ